MNSGDENMKIKLDLQPKYKEIEIHICANENTQSVQEIYQSIYTTIENRFLVYEGDNRKIVSCSDMIRIYSQNKHVYVTTSTGDYRMVERIYELEETLHANSFIRISNSEIVNLKKVERLDTSVTGTIRMYLSGGIETYVSRRYVSKIKQALGIGKGK